MKFSFIFPGQGSQSVGMMQGFDQLAIVRDTFNEASDVLGQDLWQMVVAGTPQQLDLTVNTQPLMLAVGVATYRAWRDQGGPAPEIMAGHSLGEYSALVAAQVISFTDALPLVRLRAQAMQNAVAEGAGAMAAILGLEDEVVRGLCEEAAQGEVLESVNFNSPGQVVIAGDKTAVERGMRLAREKNAKRVLLLPVSVPSHCALMRLAAEQLAAYLESVTIHTPQIPVLQNVDVIAYSDPAQIRNALARQLYRPVRWVETVRAMAALGITYTVECGPGKVLAGLNKRIDNHIQVFALTGADAIGEIKSALAG